MIFMDYVITASANRGVVDPVMGMTADEALGRLYREAAPNAIARLLANQPVSVEAASLAKTAGLQWREVPPSFLMLPGSVSMMRLLRAYMVYEIEPRARHFWTVGIREETGATLYEHHLINLRVWEDDKEVILVNKSLSSSMHVGDGAIFRAPVKTGGKYEKEGAYAALKLFCLYQWARNVLKAAMPEASSEYNEIARAYASAALQLRGASFDIYPEYRDVFLTQIEDGGDQ